jgi:hypothetical protein
MIAAASSFPDWRPMYAAMRRYPASGVSSRPVKRWKSSRSSSVSFSPNAPRRTAHHVARDGSL